MLKCHFTSVLALPKFTKATMLLLIIYGVGTCGCLFYKLERWLRVWKYLLASLMTWVPFWGWAPRAGLREPTSSYKSSSDFSIHVVTCAPIHKHHVCTHTHTSKKYMWYNFLFLYSSSSSSFLGEGVKTEFLCATIVFQELTL